MDTDNPLKGAVDLGKPEDWGEPARGTHVVLVGDVVEGFTFIGPFTSHAAAWSWLDMSGADLTKSQVVGLTSPHNITFIKL